MKNIKNISLLIIKIIITIAVSYLVCCFIIYTKLTTIHPGYKSYGTNIPTKINKGLPNQQILISPYKTFTPVNFYSKKNRTVLSGWFIENKKSNKAVILSHGHNNSKADPKQILASWLFYDLGYNVLLFDFQNHGLSKITTGKTSLGSTEYQDILGAKNFLQKKGFKKENIILWGISFGGSASLIAAQHDPHIHTIIIDSSFSDSYLIMKEELHRKNIPAIFLDGALFIANHILDNPIGEKSPWNIDQTKIKNLLIIHSKNDMRVQFHHADILHKKATKQNINSKLVPTKTDSHADDILVNHSKYKQTIKEFLKIKN